MLEDQKKNQHKGAHEAKEQRKQRRQRASDKRQEQKEEPRRGEKKTEHPNVAPSKPSFEEPGPEFYKGLKRETDEILKITEEENAKYKKKEIQSNWAKYEMPIDSYEEIDEQENLGADYEKLIQAPSSAGSHFQFKHEKSWDINTAPSLYDKYFDINMEELATAISTIPFYERCNIDQSVFSETDMLSMNHRAVKYKRKYFNDNSYVTPEIEAQDAILKNIKESGYRDDDHKSTVLKDIVLKDNIKLETNGPVNKIAENLQINDNLTSEQLVIPTIESNITKEVISLDIITEDTAKLLSKEIDEVLVNIIKIEKPNKNDAEILMVSPSAASKVFDNSRAEAEKPVIESPKPVIESPKPVIESPEDLEKWLDDFLDG